MKKIMLLLLLSSSYLTSQAQIPTGSWSGTLAIGQQKLPLVINIEKTSEDNVSCKMDSPMQGAKDIPMNVIYFKDDSMHVSIPSSAQLSYQGRLKESVLIGTFKQGSLSCPLNLQQKADKSQIRPQTPIEPYGYVTKEVSFTNTQDQVTLNGTLTYPIDYEKTKKKTPIVIMVTGSGIQNRDEEIMNHKPFLVIADYLAKQGIASLRYDDRGFGATTGSSDITTDTNYRDALAAISYAKGLKEFGSIGLLGHSEGGTIAFMAGKNHDVDFAISLAGAAVSGKELMKKQNHTHLLQSGFTPEMADAYAIAYAKVMDYMIDHPSSNQAEAEALLNEMMGINDSLKNNLMKILMKRNVWLDYFIALDPSPYIKGTKCPVMAINGSKDTQVDASQNLNAIRTLLPKNAKTLIKEYPDLNHMFQHCQTGNVTEYFLINETISPEVLSDIAQWINGLK